MSLRPHRLVAAPVTLLALTLGACGDGAAGSDAGIADAAPPDACAPALTLANLRVVENPANVLSYFVEWSTSTPATTELQVDCGPDFQLSFTGDGETDEHRVFVMGLLEGATCQLTATSAAACAASETTSIEVADLPTYVPGFHVETGGGPIESGWTILNLNGLQANAPFLVVIVDEQGRVRWYHRRDTDHPSGSTDVRVLPEGVLIAGSPQVAAALVDWTGAIVWEADIDAHHELLPIGSDQYLYLLTHFECPDGYSSDSVIKWDQATKTQLWEWRICDHYTPPVFKNDWAHVNTIELFPGGDAMLLSPRDQDNLMKVDMTTGDLEWVLGQNGDFTLAAGDHFLRQHAPEILPSGNILLFDNGLAGVRESSRAIEIAYDATAKTAAVVWEYEPTPTLFTPIWGDVDRLANGNTLVTFGSNDPAVRSRLIEVEPSGTESWTLIFDLGWGVYRSERIAVPEGAHAQ